MLKNKILSFSLLVTCFTSVWGVPVQPIDNPPVYEYIENHLKLEGKLEEKNGFIYVKVPDSWIYGLHALMMDAELNVPHYFGPGLVGAHITVANLMEACDMPVDLPELGETFHFEVVSVGSFIQDWKKKEIFVVELESPELEALRESYGLSPLPNGHRFHITFGEKGCMSICGKPGPDLGANIVSYFAGKGEFTRPQIIREMGLIPSRATGSEVNRITRQLSNEGKLQIIGWGHGTTYRVLQMPKR